MLQDLGSDHLPILLSVPLSPVFRPNERPPSFNFQKARWDDFDSHCPFAEEYSSLSSAAALFTSLALNAAKSSIPFGRIKRHPKAWWSPEVEGAVSKRRKSFAAAHRRDEDCEAYISASRRASSVIAKAKAEAWQTTCFSLSPKSNPKTVHFLLRSIAGSSSSSSSSPNFPNCSSPRELASVYAALPEIPLSLMIFVFVCHLPSAALFRLSTWLLILFPVGTYYGGSHTRSSDSDSSGALV